MEIDEDIDQALNEAEERLYLGNAKALDADLNAILFLKAQKATSASRRR